MAKAKPDAADVVAARVLCAVTVNGARYQPNDVLENLPADVLAAHADALDPHPDAVAYAKSEGGAVHQYEG